MKIGLIWCCLILIVFACNAAAQGLAAERELHKQVLKNLQKDLTETYYDPNLKGVDLETSIKKAAELIQNAKSVEEMTDIVMRVLHPFDDSHLRFLPPARTIEIDYGWSLIPIGEKVYIRDLDESSDAWKKGLRPGDQIYMIDGFLASREHFVLLSYHYQILSPKAKIELIVLKPSKNSYRVEIEPKLTRNSVFRPSRRELELTIRKQFVERTRQGFFEPIPGLAVWRIPSFEFSDIKVSKMIDKIDKGVSLILDLRDNSGGYVYSLDELIRVFFENDVSVVTTLSRKGAENIKVKGAGRDAFKGKLIVLIDGGSASAAEVFARIIQLENRGKVVGDRSSGQVMQSRIYPHFHGIDGAIGYGFSITTADLLMKDGKRLEKVGVMPDELVLPSQTDILERRDPALSKAAKMLGFTLSPEDAGKLYSKK